MRHSGCGAQGSVLAMGVSSMMGIVLGSTFMIIGLGLGIGGVAKLHEDCNDSLVFSESCADRFRPTWWAINFSVVVFIGAMIFMLTSAMQSTRVVSVFFLVMAAVEVMDEVEKALVLRDTRFWERIDGSESAVDVAISGLAFLAAGQWLMIISLGVTKG